MDLEVLQPLLLVPWVALGLLPYVFGIWASVLVLRISRTQEQLLARLSLKQLLRQPRGPHRDLRHC
jgi:hypothetical protein